MTVKELRKILKNMPGELEVSITNGYEGEVYQGDFEIQLFEDVDGKYYVDIGIGGLNK